MTFWNSGKTEEMTKMEKLTSEKNIICIILSYAAAYLYVCGGPDWFWSVILILFTASAEIMFSDVKRTAESFVWYICLTLCILSLSFCYRSPVYDHLFAEYNNIWEKWEVWMFAHFFAMWWVLSRSGKLIDGQTGRFFLTDFFSGCLGTAFRNLFSRLRLIASSVKKVFSVIVAVLVLILLGIAVALLESADPGFSALLEMIGGSLRLSGSLEDTLFTIVLSLPVGAFIFGLIYGNSRRTSEEITGKRDRLESGLSKIKIAPAGLFTSAAVLFSVVYLVFFIIQGSYLFGGFMRLLPEGFTVSSYARKGFFELCSIIAVNFSFIWMATHTVSADSEKSRPLFISCMALLAESIVFSAISFSKLFLYISCFGFTKLRLQSIWFTVILAAGSALWIHHLITGRPAFRKWMYLSCITLSMLTLF